MNSEHTTPMIEKGRTLRWEEWLAGRRARRETGKRVAPEVVRRDAGSNDRRLRELFAGERGLPFAATKDL